MATIVREYVLNGIGDHGCRNVILNGTEKQRLYNPTLVYQASPLGSGPALLNVMGDSFLELVLDVLEPRD